MVSKKQVTRMINLVVDSILDHDSVTRFAFFDLRLGAWKKEDPQAGNVRFLRLGFRRNSRRMEVFLSESDVWEKVTESRGEFCKVHDLLPNTDYSGILEATIKRRTAALMKAVNPEAKKSWFEVRVDALRYEFPQLLNLPIERYAFGQSGETFVIRPPVSEESKTAAAQ